jgi:hypothetical protein
MTTFVAASDLHGDRQDRTSRILFDRFVQDFKPKRRFFLGDIFDFRALRSGADEDEKRHSMKDDFDAGMDFLESFRPNVVLLGNHDIRLWRTVEVDGLRKSGPLTDFATILIERFDRFVAKTNTLVLPYDKRRGVYSESGLRMVHGFDRMAASTMATTYGNVIYGHGHAIETATAPSITEKTARQIGALTRLDLDYNRSQTRTLKQANGFAYGAFFGQNKHEVMQARVTGKQVVYAADLKQIAV